MGDRSYPLEAVVEQRSEEVDAAVQALGAARRRQAAALDAVNAAASALAAFDRDTARATKQRSAPADAPARVHDGMLQRAFDSRRHHERAKLATRLGGAEVALVEADSLAEAARLVLAHAHAELHAVSEHRERFRQRLREQGEAAEQEEAEELAARGPRRT